MSAGVLSVPILSSIGWIGVIPAALTAASSMPVAYMSPTSFSTPVASVFAAAASASCLLAASERSVSISKLPQVVRSFGIGWAASHLLLTKSARLSQTFLLVSRSAMENAAVGGRSAADVAGAAGAAVVAGAAGAAGAAACCCPGQPVSTAVTARDNNNVLGLLTITLNSGPSGGSVDNPATSPGLGQKGEEWRGFAQCTPDCSGDTCWQRVSKVMAVA